MRWVILGILILSVACGTAAARTAKSNPAPVGEVMQVQGTQANPDSSTQVLGNYDQLVVTVEAMGELVAELWERVQALQWTEAEAIAVVRRALDEKLESCGNQHSHPAALFGGGVGQAESCIAPGEYTSDPVFKAIRFGSPIPSRFVTSFLRSILEELEWSADYQPKFLRWTVIGIQQSTTMRFFVDERTGLVEADTRTAEQLLEDILKEAN